MEKSAVVIYNMDQLEVTPTNGTALQHIYAFEPLEDDLTRQTMRQVLNNSVTTLISGSSLSVATSFLTSARVSTFSIISLEGRH